MRGFEGKPLISFYWQTFLLNPDDDNRDLKGNNSAHILKHKQFFKVLSSRWDVPNVEGLNRWALFNQKHEKGTPAILIFIVSKY